MMAAGVVTPCLIPELNFAASFFLNGRPGNPLRYEDVVDEDDLPALE